MLKKVKLHLTWALPIFFAASFLVVINAGCEKSEEVDQLIFQAKQEARKTVPSSSVEISAEESSPKEAFLESKLMEIQEVKDKLKKTPLPGEKEAQSSNIAGENTKVVPSPQAEAPETSTLSGASASSLTELSSLYPGLSDNHPGVESATASKPEKPKPKVSPYRTYLWGQGSSNNILAIRALTPDSGIWTSGKLNLSGFFVKVTVKNISVVPLKVKASSFKIITSVGKSYTAKYSENYYDDGHEPIFQDRVLLPNQKYTAYLHLVFMKSTDIDEIWAPDTSTVKYFRCLQGKPKIQYCY